MTADHEKLMNALLVQLNLQRAGLRKRAIQCLGTFSPLMPKEKSGLSMSGLYPFFCGIIISCQLHMRTMHYHIYLF